MKQTFFLLFFAGLLFFNASDRILYAQTTAYQQTEANEEVFVVFTPPCGWHLADLKSMPFKVDLVKIMVIGTGPSNYQPRLTLSVEPYKKSLKDYLKMIKKKNTASGYEWKDLGYIKTDAGKASLSQVDTKTQWGELRRMDVILLKTGKIYVLTATALKTEFHLFYNDFFTSMRSLRIVKDTYDTITDIDQRNQLKNSVENVKNQWKILLEQKQQKDQINTSTTMKAELFTSDTFQNIYWKPFREMLTQKFSQFGLEWQFCFLEKVKNQLIDESDDSQ